MLKKLAKYGNSTTLVIDKAILELLNMNESSVVKLQTDGKSLIITPVQPEQAQDKKVSYDAQEGILQALASFKDQAMQNVTPVEYEHMISTIQATDDVVTAQKEMANLFSKSAAMRDFAVNSPNNSEFQDRVVAIAQQYDPVSNHPEYIKAYKVVRNEFYPEMAKLDLEIAKIFKKIEIKK